MISGNRNRQGNPVITHIKAQLPRSRGQTIRLPDGQSADDFGFYDPIDGFGLAQSGLRVLFTDGVSSAAYLARARSVRPFACTLSNTKPIEASMAAMLKPLAD